MNPMLADAIDIPYVLGFGLVVLVPLMLFEVGIEALVLNTIWRIHFWKLCRYTLVANFLSLLAGIPVKILNAWLYGFLLPDDLPGFFARYPSAVAIGSLVYFVVTLGVEGAYAFRWLHRNEYVITSGSVWKGVVLANLASYLVLAPLHYYLTRPIQQIREFSPNTSSFSRPADKVIFTDAVSGNLKAVRLNDSSTETIVPLPVRDYLLSADLKICLFRGTNNNLYIYRRVTSRSDLVLQASERFLMNQVAFSPSGQYVAFASESSNAVEVVDTQTGQHIYQPLETKLSFFSGASIAWSTNEEMFYVSGFDSHDRFLFTIRPLDGLKLEKLTDTNTPPVLTCYGRLGSAGWYGAEDWGRSFHEDSCGDLKIWTEPGLGSHLSIYHDDHPRTAVLYLSVNPGLLHIARFDFDDVAFLQDCRECLFEANGYIYLLDIQEKRAGTVVHGDRFILLTPRYQKQL
jgi:hypothetical protein